MSQTEDTSRRHFIKQIGLGALALATGACGKAERAERDVYSVLRELDEKGLTMVDESGQPFTANSLRTLLKQHGANFATVSFGRALCDAYCVDLGYVLKQVGQGNEGQLVSLIVNSTPDVLGRQTPEKLAAMRKEFADEMKAYGMSQTVITLYPSSNAASAEIQMAFNAITDKNKPGDHTANIKLFNAEGSCLQKVTGAGSIKESAINKLRNAIDSQKQITR